MCRSRRELSNAYLLAKFGFDTAENEPSKVRARHPPGHRFFSRGPHLLEAQDAGPVRVQALEGVAEVAHVPVPGEVGRLRFF